MKIFVCMFFIVYCCSLVLGCTINPNNYTNVVQLNQMSEPGPHSFQYPFNLQLNTSESDSIYAIGAEGGGPGAIYSLSIKSGYVSFIDDTMANSSIHWIQPSSNLFALELSSGRAVIGSFNNYKLLIYKDIYSLHHTTQIVDFTIPNMDYLENSAIHFGNDGLIYMWLTYSNQYPQNVGIYTYDIDQEKLSLYINLDNYQIWDSMEDFYITQDTKELYILAQDSFGPSLYIFSITGPNNNANLTNTIGLHTFTAPTGLQFDFTKQVVYIGDRWGGLYSIGLQAPNTITRIDINACLAPNAIQLSPEYQYIYATTTYAVYQVNLSKN